MISTSRQMRGLLGAFRVGLVLRLSSNVLDVGAYNFDHGTKL